MSLRKYFLLIKRRSRPIAVLLFCDKKCPVGYTDRVNTINLQRGKSNHRKSWKINIPEF
jgi:hypothetical protein